MMTEYSLVDTAKKEKNKKTRRWIICGTVFVTLIILLLVLVFVIFPVVFMYDIKLQRALIFTNFNLPTERSYFTNFYKENNITGLRNLYVTIKQSDDSSIDLGVWHLLPANMTNGSTIDDHFDYDDALMSSNFSVLLNFHGSGEARSYFIEKTLLFSQHFHVINFDYRSFADSSSAILSEDAVVNDSVQLYKWLLMHTNSPIYIWSHSLGTALATRTIAILQEQGIEPKGLFLESGFTSMREELPVHPYGKVFAWLPYFKQMVQDPLERNHFIFNTSCYLSKTSCPVMVMHAEDDDIIPVEFGEKLFEVARSRKITTNIVQYYQFDAGLDYGHEYIYQDPRLSGYITSIRPTTIQTPSSMKVSHLTLEARRFNGPTLVVRTIV